MRCRQYDLAAGYRMRLIIDGRAAIAVIMAALAPALTLTAGALGNRRHDLFPVGRIERFHFRTYWHRFASRYLRPFPPPGMGSRWLGGRHDAACTQSSFRSCDHPRDQASNPPWPFFGGHSDADKSAATPSRNASDPRPFPGTARLPYRFRMSGRDRAEFDSAFTIRKRQLRATH